MDKITYRFLPLQRWLVLLIPGVALPIAIILFGLKIRFLYVPLPLAAFLAVWAPNKALAPTTIGDAGVLVRQPLRRRSLAWTEVKSVGVREDTGRGTDRWVELEMVSGCRLRLPAPLDSTNGGDPLFTEKLETVERYWKTATGATEPGRTA